MLAPGLEGAGVGQEVIAEQGPGRFQIRAARGAGLEAGDQGASLVGLTTVISGQGLRLTDQR